VSFNNRATDGHPHSGSVFPCCKESIEYLVRLVLRKLDARIFYGNYQLFVIIAPGLNCERMRTTDGLYRISAIDHQVTQYLL
jgi:hypothetical protein